MNPSPKWSVKFEVGSTELWLYLESVKVEQVGNQTLFADGTRIDVPGTIVEVRNLKD